MLFSCHICVLNRFWSQRLNNLKLLSTDLILIWWWKGAAWDLLSNLPPCSLPVSAFTYSNSGISSHANSIQIWPQGFLSNPCKWPVPQVKQQSVPWKSCMHRHNASVLMKCQKLNVTGKLTLLTFLSILFFLSASSPSLKMSSLSPEERLIEEHEEVEEDCKILERIGWGEGLSCAVGSSLIPSISSASSSFGVPSLPSFSPSTADKRHLIFSSSSFCSLSILEFLTV